MKGKKYIIEKKYITQKELDDLDIIIKDGLGINEDDELVYTIYSDKGFSWAAESQPILIDTLLKELNKMKQKCNYVEIMYHEDHFGYILNGLSINASFAGSKKYNELKRKIMLDKKKSIESAIKAHSKSIEELNKKIKNLKNENKK